MNVKTKKLSNGRVVRIESIGSVKEVIIKEDLLKPEELKVEVCYKGSNASGIIELSRAEIEMLYEEIAPKIDVIGKVSVKKFKKV